MPRTSDNASEERNGLQRFANFDLYHSGALLHVMALELFQEIYGGYTAGSRFVLLGRSRLRRKRL